MIEHESDLWPERRWAIVIYGSGAVRALPFRNTATRDAWVYENPRSRRAVGKRHPAVMSLRQRWRQEALESLAEWKART